MPVVVAESQKPRNLRSLLKMPSLLSEAFCEDLERRRKLCPSSTTSLSTSLTGGQLP